MDQFDPVPPASDELPQRMTRAELARHWRVTQRTIERHESAGIGLLPFRIGGRVLYRREDVLAWEQRQSDRFKP